MSTTDGELVKAVNAIDTTLTSKLSGKLSLERSLPDETPDQSLWVAIRNRADAISFTQYKAFIDAILCGDGEDRVTSRFLFTASVTWPENENADKTDLQ